MPAPVSERVEVPQFVAEPPRVLVNCPPTESVLPLFTLKVVWFVRINELVAVACEFNENVPVPSIITLLKLDAPAFMSEVVDPVKRTVPPLPTKVPVFV